MDIPRERIVGLIAMGLITGALLRVIYQALQERRGHNPTPRSAAKGD